MKFVFLICNGFYLVEFSGCLPGWNFGSKISFYEPPESSNLGCMLISDNNAI